MKHVFSYFLLGFLLAVPAGAGLYYLVMYTQPYLRERWLFFIALFVFVSGALLPFFALLNRYFFTAKRINPPTVIREAIGSALIADLLLWFQMGRVLTPTIIMLCIGSFFVAELLLRAREAVEFRSGIDD
ncbi:MAG: hypothetical protein IKP86_06275 [Anaerolineaceae bacterium]|nr:hypothetical protein [Anaerolineaceae bacterium]